MRAVALDKSPASWGGAGGAGGGGRQVGNALERQENGTADRPERGALSGSAPGPPVAFSLSPGSGLLVFELLSGDDASVAQVSELG